MQDSALSVVDTPPGILVVEDDEAFRLSVGRAIELAGHRVSLCEDAESALDQLAEIAPALVLTDLRLPRADGLFLLDSLREAQPDLPVVLMTGHGDIPTAIQAIRGGAYDFLEKPFSRERLLAVVQRGFEQHRLLNENRRLRHQLAAASGIDQVVRGDSAPMRELRDLVLRLAPTSVDVLVHGETGTGKELVARCLHDYSKRSGHFVALNCAAVPEALFESELFGHEANAFGGAAHARVGKIEHAQGGTLFLDEVDAMPPALQAKVLRVLQEREIERLGSNKPVAVDFRVVAATKANLEELARKGGFRPDLFYRLNVASLTLAPLRDRPGDIPGLFDGFMRQASLRHQMPLPTVGADLQQALLAAEWPGNVRELKACAERLVLGLPPFVDAAGAQPAPRSFDESIALVERSLLEAALRRHGGSVKAACTELSLTPATIYRKIKALGIEPTQFKPAGQDPA